MKRTVKTGMVLVLLITGTMALSAQNMGGMQMDTAKMHRGMMMHRGMQGMNHQMMRPGWPGMRGRMGQMPAMRSGMGQMPGRLSGHGQMPGMRGMGRPGMGMGPGMYGRGLGGWMFENIPDLTDKQKKDIAVLRIDQQTEMKKFQTEMQAKMKAMRDAHRSAIEKILTPEQKKWLDENAPKPSDNTKTATTPAKTK